MKFQIFSAVVAVGSALHSAHESQDNDGNGVAKVFIMMGQSNMVGMAEFDKLEEVVSHYPYLWDSAKGSWSVDKTIRQVFTLASGNSSFTPESIIANSYMTGNERKDGRMGPELGIGSAISNHTAGKVPTLLLKSCIGGRALGWDLLPPGSPRWLFNDTYEVCGYGDGATLWDKDKSPPPYKPATWYAGRQWDGDIARAQYILDHISDFYPGVTNYEIAGFFWWQGSNDASFPKGSQRDKISAALSYKYEDHLVHYINTVRETFKAPPTTPMVIATLGQTLKNATGANDGNEGYLMQAMLNVDGDSGKYPAFKGNVKTVYSHPYSMGGVSYSHYNYNPMTYMNIGEAMGQAMVSLLHY